MSLDSTSELAELSRLTQCNEAIFEAANEWLATEETPAPRPLSLASLEALLQMGIPYDSLDYDTREIALYRWLHVYPLRDVKLALWNGSWSLLFHDAVKLSEETVAQFRDDQKRVRGIIAATTVTTRKKPRKTDAADDTPPDVIAPTLAWHRIATIARVSNMKPEEVAWMLPIGQALALYHDALWSDGNWTVQPGTRATPEELEDLTPGEL